jgi:hypothetical protein
MGTVNIEWPEVARVESRYNYEFRLTNGERYFGSMAGDSRAGQLAVLNPVGDRQLEVLEVVEIRPIEEHWLDRLDAYLSVGYQYTRASSVAQTTLNTEVSYEDQNTRNQLTGRTTLTDTDGNSSDSNRYDINRAVWTDRSQWFRTVFANYEDNDELALDHRIGAGGGFGRFWIDNNRMRWLGVAGLQAITEKSVGIAESQDVELFLNTSFATWRFSTPELDMDLRFSLYPSVTDAGRLRTDSSLRVRWEIIEDLFFDISAWGTTDNKSEGDESYDYGITTGLGWEY